MGKKGDREKAVRMRYRELPPEVILGLLDIQYPNPEEFDRAQWLWEHRVKEKFLKPWRQAIALVVILVGSGGCPTWWPYSIGLAIVGLGAFSWVVLAVACSVELRRWRRWKADYSRAVDRILGGRGG